MCVAAKQDHVMCSLSTVWSVKTTLWDVTSDLNVTCGRHSEKSFSQVNESVTFDLL